MFVEKIREFVHEQILNGIPLEFLIRFAKSPIGQCTGGIERTQMHHGFPPESPRTQSSV
jgi:hypothetical protein